MSFKEGSKAVGSVIGAWILILVLLLGSVTAVYFFVPHWLGLQRKAFKASHQYVEGGNQALLTMNTEFLENKSRIEMYRAENNDGRYNDLIQTLETQNRGLMIQMKEKANLIGLDKIPSAVLSTISTN